MVDNELGLYGAGGIVKNLPQIYKGTLYLYIIIHLFSLF